MMRPIILPLLTSLGVIVMYRRFDNRLLIAPSTTLQTLYLPDLRKITDAQLQIWPQVGLKDAYVTHSGDTQRVCACLVDTAWHGCSISVAPEDFPHEEFVSIELEQIPGIAKNPERVKI